MQTGNSKAPWVLGIGALAVAGAWAYMANRLPRGYRNNSPGNLRPMGNGLTWNGEIAPDTGINGPYSRFQTPFYGWRAMTVDVYGDIVQDHLNTIQKLVHEYAPALDNNNEAEYAAYLSQALHIAPDFTLNVYTHGPSLLRAIAQYENKRIDPDTIWGSQPRLDGIDAGVAHLRSMGRL